MLNVTEGLIIPHLIADCPSFGQANMPSYENIFGAKIKKRCTNIVLISYYLPTRQVVRRLVQKNNTLFYILDLMQVLC
jgi:hypothetical protein